MKLNPGLDAARQRWQAWFDGTLTGGPILAVTAPLDRPRETPLAVVPPATLAARKTDPEFVAVSARNAIMATWYGGDAIPSMFVNLGPGCVAGFLGGQVTIDERTTWFGGLGDDGLDFIARSLRYDSGNAYWRTAQAITRRALEVAGGDYWVSYTDLGGELDVLASLRGTEKLLGDLIDAPEAVMRCEERIAELWLRYFTELTDLIKARQGGFTTWLPCWSARPWYSLQCDLSAMFSPAMFRQFVVPMLRRKLAAMGRSVYHWDGPGELAHLDLLVATEGIAALEYVSVPCDPPNCDGHWLPYYRRVASAGRGVLLRTQRPDLALELSRRMPAERLALVVSVKTVAQAQDVLRQFGRG